MTRIKRNVFLVCFYLYMVTYIMCSNVYPNLKYVNKRLHHKHLSILQNRR
jgi:hypothetical protein